MIYSRGWRFKAFTFAWVTGCILTLMLFTPRVASAFLIDFGNILLTRSVLFGNTSLQETSLKSFEFAQRVYLNPRAFRGAGRILLRKGDYGRAIKSLGFAYGHSPANPILFSDLVSAYSHTGQDNEVIKLDQQGTVRLYSSILSDTVALSYLNLAKPLIDSGQWADAEPYLRRAVKIRPADLYAWYQLGQIKQDESGDQGVVLRKRFVYFSLEAIKPTEVRLLDYETEVIPSLMKEGFWPHQLTKNVVSFLVWKYPTNAAVERLLKQLKAQWTSDELWPFYLGELYQRRGEIEQAREQYVAALQLNPNCDLARLRLGMIYETQFELTGEEHFLREAAKWYLAYRERYPQDLWALRHTTNVLQRLKDSRSVTLRERLNQSTDERPVVASILDVPANRIQFGVNLVVDGGFEERPGTWMWMEQSASHFEGDWGAGTFAGGDDTLNAWEGEQSKRVDALWIQFDEKPNPARAGFWQRNDFGTGRAPIELQPSMPYLLSFYYRTEDVVGEQFSLWFSFVPWKYDLYLPVTDGQWRKVIGVMWSLRSDPAIVEPLWRLWGSGRVWVDQFEIRPIECPHCKRRKMGESILKLH